jgi:putative DNA primase/helicase
MTGGDHLSGRDPAGRPFDFAPTHKLMMHGNYMPRLRGMASGLKRRLGILPFARKPRKVDQKLKEILHEEGPGILRWLLDGVLDYQRNGLQPPPDVLAATREYFQQQDTFRRWIEECCELSSDPDAKVAPGDLRSRFNRWARGNGEEPMSTNDFSVLIGRFVGPKGTRLRQVKIQGKLWVRGIRIRMGWRP